MVIRVFTSHLSANNSIRNQQRHIIDVLQAKSIEFEETDISNPANEDRKSFMQENCPPSSNGKPPLPPQIFTDDTYCGGYEEFLDAVEGEELWSFLHLQVPPEEDLAKMKPLHEPEPGEEETQEADTEESAQPEENGETAGEEGTEKEKENGDGDGEEEEGEAVMNEDAAEAGDEEAAEEHADGDGEAAMEEEPVAEEEEEEKEVVEPEEVADEEAMNVEQNEEATEEPEEATAEAEEQVADEEEMNVEQNEDGNEEEQPVAEEEPNPETDETVAAEEDDEQPAGDGKAAKTSHDLVATTGNVVEIATRAAHVATVSEFVGEDDIRTAEIIRASPDAVKTINEIVGNIEISESTECYEALRDEVISELVEEEHSGAAEAVEKLASTALENEQLNETSTEGIDETSQEMVNTMIAENTDNHLDADESNESAGQDDEAAKNIESSKTEVASNGGEMEQTIESKPVESSENTVQETTDEEKMVEVTKGDSAEEDEAKDIEQFIDEVEVDESSTEADNEVTIQPEDLVENSDESNNCDDVAQTVTEDDRLIEESTEVDVETGVVDEESKTEPCTATEESTEPTVSENGEETSNIEEEATNVEEVIVESGVDEEIAEQSAEPVENSDELGNGDDFAQTVTEDDRLIEESTEVDVETGVVDEESKTEPCTATEESTEPTVSKNGEETSNIEEEATNVEEVIVESGVDEEIAEQSAEPVENSYELGNGDDATESESEENEVAEESIEAETAVISDESNIDITYSLEDVAEVTEPLLLKTIDDEEMVQIEEKEVEVVDESDALDNYDEATAEADEKAVAEKSEEPTDVLGNKSTSDEVSKTVVEVNTEESVKNGDEAGDETSMKVVAAVNERLNAKAVVESETTEETTAIIVDDSGETTEREPSVETTKKNEASDEEVDEDVSETQNGVEEASGNTDVSYNNEEPVSCSGEAFKELPSGDDTEVVSEEILTQIENTEETEDIIETIEMNEKEDESVVENNDSSVEEEQEVQETEEKPDSVEKTYYGDESENGCSDEISTAETSDEVAEENAVGSAEAVEREPEETRADDETSDAKDETTDADDDLNETSYADDTEPTKKSENSFVENDEKFDKTLMVFAAIESNPELGEVVASDNKIGDEETIGDLEEATETVNDSLDNDGADTVDESSENDVKLPQDSNEGCTKETGMTKSDEPIENDNTEKEDVSQETSGEAAAENDDDGDDRSSELETCQVASDESVEDESTVCQKKTVDEFDETIDVAADVVLDEEKEAEEQLDDDDKKFSQIENKSPEAKITPDESAGDTSSLDVEPSGSTEVEGIMADSGFKFDEDEVKVFEKVSENVEETSRVANDETNENVENTNDSCLVVEMDEKGDKNAEEPETSVETADTPTASSEETLENDKKSGELDEVEALEIGEASGSGQQLASADNKEKNSKTQTDSARDDEMTEGDEEANVLSDVTAKMEVDGEEAHGEDDTRSPEE